MGVYNISEVGTRRTCLTPLDGDNCTYALNFGIQVQCTYLQGLASMQECNRSKSSIQRSCPRVGFAEIIFVTGGVPRYGHEPRFGELKAGDPAIGWSARTRPSWLKPLGAPEGLYYPDRDQEWHKRGSEAGQLARSDS